MMYILTSNAGKAVSMQVYNENTHVLRGMPALLLVHFF